jgi:hypothetical protein
LDTQKLLKQTFQGEKIMKVWITKHALTSGILIFDNASTVEGQPDKIFVPLSKGGGYFKKDEWYTEEEKAIEKARSMQDKRLDSLQKQMDKVSALSFD